MLKEISPDRRAQQERKTEMIHSIGRPRKDGKVLVTHVFPLSGRTIRKLMSPEEARAKLDAEKGQPQATAKEIERAHTFRA